LTEVVSIPEQGAETARSALEHCVSSGGVAIFPADTLYGLACDPLNEAAVARVHRLKGRDDGKSSAVLYFSPLAMRELVSELDARAGAAISALLPGPVTLILPNPKHRYPLACLEDPGRLGVRLVAGPLEGVMTPVFQTSANRSGKPPPPELAAVDPAIVDEVDLAIEGGRVGGAPSTVIDLTRLDDDGTWTVLREGALSEKEVAALLESR